MLIGLRHHTLIHCHLTITCHFQISARFGADSETAKALSEVVKCRQSDLRRAVANHSCKLQPHYLQDFDWELNVSSSSQLAGQILEIYQPYVIKVLILVKSSKY